MHSHEVEAVQLRRPDDCGLGVLERVVNFSSRELVAVTDYVDRKSRFTLVSNDS